MTRDDADFFRGVARGRKQFATELHAMLFPEQYPPGNEHHDPDHIYWAGGHHESDAEFRWSAETIEWVAQALDAELTDDGSKP